MAHQTDTVRLPAGWEIEKFGNLILSYKNGHTQNEIETACLKAIDGLPPPLKVEMGKFVQEVNALWEAPDAWSGEAGRAHDLIVQKLAQLAARKNFLLATGQDLQVFQIVVLNFALWAHTDDELRTWIDKATNKPDDQTPEVKGPVSFRAPRRDDAEFPQRRPAARTPHARSAHAQQTSADLWIRRLTASLIILSSLAVFAYLLVPWASRDHAQVTQTEAQPKPLPAQAFDMEPAAPPPKSAPVTQEQEKETAGIEGPENKSDDVETASAPAGPAEPARLPVPAAPLEAPVEAPDEPPVPRTQVSPAIEDLLGKVTVDGDVRLRHGDPAGALGSYMLAAYLGNGDAGRHLEKMDEAAPAPAILDKNVDAPVDSCEIKVVSIAPFASTSSTLAMGLRLAPKDGKSRARIEHVGADSGNAQLIVSRAPEKGSPVLLALIGIPRTASRFDMIAVCGDHASSIKLTLAQVLANISLANQTGDRR